MGKKNKQADNPGRYKSFSVEGSSVQRAINASLAAAFNAYGNENIERVVSATAIITSRDTMGHPSYYLGIVMVKVKKGAKHV